MSLDFEMSCTLGDLLQEKLKIGSKYKVTYVLVGERHTVTGTLDLIKVAKRFYHETYVHIQKKDGGKDVPAHTIIRIQEVA